MNALEARIKALIAAQGPISVAQYMTMALHDAQNGYYATREPFGADFVTAPEISQMFGEMLGLWCVQVWHDQGRPAKMRLVELGPGRGTLMADALRAARVTPEFLIDLDVVMIEASPLLRQIQQDRLKDCGAAVRWTTHFDDSVADRPLLLLANEFFDALPIRQYVKTERGWCERMVILRDDKLDFALAPTPTPSAAIPATRAGTPKGGVYEISPAAGALIERIAGVVAAKGGGALLIDYGYGDVTGYGETLQALGGHKFKDVLLDPGENDLSAHVDFMALARAGRHGGASVHGPRGQGVFLTDLGIMGRAERLTRVNPAAAQSLAAAAHRLTAHEKMGDLFKALAFMPPSAEKPPGF
jgi:NADH dehydrogenase [ubiquinone] 1 alpha subcomplex assembly factor 7